MQSLVRVWRTSATTPIAAAFGTVLVLIGFARQTVRCWVTGFDLPRR